MKVTFLPAGSVTFQPAITRSLITGSQVLGVHEEGLTVLQLAYSGFTEESEQLTFSSRDTEASASEVRTTWPSDTDALETDSILHSRGQSSPGSASISSVTSRSFPSTRQTVRRALLT